MLVFNTKIMKINCYTNEDFLTNYLICYLKVKNVCVWSTKAI